MDLDCGQSQASGGSVAKTSGSLIEVAKVLIVARPTHLVHEPQATLQVASLSIRNHLAVCAVVLAIPPQLPQSRRDDAGKGS